MPYQIWSGLLSQMPILSSIAAVTTFHAYSVEYIFKIFFAVLGVQLITKHF